MIVIQLLAMTSIINSIGKYNVNIHLQWLQGSYQWHLLVIDELPHLVVLTSFKNNHLVNYCAVQLTLYYMGGALCACTCK